MQSVLQIGTSIQEHQKKEIHTTTKTTNSTVKNNNQLYNLLKKTIFLFQTDEFLKESLHMFDTQKKLINEQYDSIRCAKNQNNGAHH